MTFCRFCETFCLLYATFCYDTYTQLEDVVGLPSGLCCKGVGSLKGACPWCRVEGVRKHKTTKYMDAITHTPSDSALRGRFQEEFKRHPDLDTLHKQRPPKQRTSVEAIDSGQRVKRARDGSASKTALETLKKNEPFTDVDAFSLRFHQWDKLARTIVDPAHEILNLVRDILHLITSMKDSSMAFTTARKVEENNSGRFMETQVCLVVFSF